MRLRQIGYIVRASKVIGLIIEERQKVCYIKVPGLKTHSMTILTAGKKNQYGFIKYRDSSVDHSYRFHRKLSDYIYR